MPVFWFLFWIGIGVFQSFLFHFQLQLVMDEGQNVIERFNIDHTAMVEKISDLSFIPKAFNPRVEEKKSVRGRKSISADPRHSVDLRSSTVSEIYFTFTVLWLGIVIRIVTFCGEWIQSCFMSAFEDRISGSLLPSAAWHSWGLNPGLPHPNFSL